MCCNNNNGMQRMQISRIVTSRFDEHRKGKNKHKKRVKREMKKEAKEGKKEAKIITIKY